MRNDERPYQRESEMSPSPDPIRSSCLVLDSIKRRAGLIQRSFILKCNDEYFLMLLRLMQVSSQNTGKCCRPQSSVNVLPDSLAGATTGSPTFRDQNRQPFGTLS